LYYLSRMVLHCSHEQLTFSMKNKLLHIFCYTSVTLIVREMVESPSLEVFKKRVGVALQDTV